MRRSHVAEAVDLDGQGCAGETNEDDPVAAVLLEHELAKVPVGDEEHPVPPPRDGQCLAVREAGWIVAGDDLDVVPEVLQVGDEPRSRYWCRSLPAGGACGRWGQRTADG